MYVRKEKRINEKWLTFEAWGLKRKKNLQMERINLWVMQFEYV